MSIRPVSHACQGVPLLLPRVATSAIAIVATAVPVWVPLPSHIHNSPHPIAPMTRHLATRPYVGALTMHSSSCNAHAHYGALVKGRSMVCRDGALVMVDTSP